MRDHEVSQFFFLKKEKARHGAGVAGAGADVNVKDGVLMFFLEKKIYEKKI